MFVGDKHTNNKNVLVAGCNNTSPVYRMSYMAAYHKCIWSSEGILATVNFFGFVVVSLGIQLSV